ncbi:MAG TPA: two pore domain potassium channel family protein, partial [Candidatus Tenderia electrophaga]|nr:two pore domain potassium channel family protein [Candidatus Tenderia electrophaga]
RKRILVVILTAFIAHLIEITLYGFSYLVIAEWIGSGSLGGQPAANFYDYFYYSIATYTTLGIGDFYPMEGLRILTGMESLIGLMMITWTASFTYLNMEKFWKLH